MNWVTPLNAITTALGGSAYPKLTKINSTGIYTGTLSAEQITAGKLSAARLDAAAIRADIINTAYINGLSCTFSKGSIGGWTISSTEIFKGNVVLSSNGSIVNSSRWSLNSDGSGTLAKGNISWDVKGNVTAKGAVFNNVRIQGSVRNPFVLNDSTIWIGGSTSDQQNFNNYDNIVAVRGSYTEIINLPWTLDNSGRRMTLVNYKWGTNTTVGYMSISAPSGKYFFEDGLQKNSISFSREYVELLGYGDDKTFFGWIVTNRRDIMTTKQYGSFQQVMYSGYVSNGTIVKQLGYDGGSCSCERFGVGFYRVRMPRTFADINDYNVMLTGVALNNADVYASLHLRTTSYFEVRTADDSSSNDSGFLFQVISMGNWT